MQNYKNSGSTLKAHSPRPVALFLLSCAALLTGCGATVPKPVIILTIDNPALLNCEDAPPVPDLPDTDWEGLLMEYTIEDHAAGQDCRDKLGTIRELSEKNTPSN